MMRLHISSGSFDQADCGAKFRMLPWLFARGAPRTLPWAAKQFERAP